VDTTQHSAIRLYPLTFVEEGDEVVIGRLEVESYAVFPADAAAAVRRLQAGHSTQQVAEWYTSTYEEDADIDDLVEMLRDLQFVRQDAGAGDGGDDRLAGGPADGSDATGEQAPDTPALRWTRLARAAFCVPAWIGYGLVVGAAVAAMVHWADLRPSPSYTFFTPSLVVVVLALLFAQLPGLAWHEGYHVLAGRRLGLPARVNIGRRLYFVVFQTTLTGLMSVPRSKRILPFCAGMVADLTNFSLMVCAAATDQAINHGALNVLGRFFLAVAFSTLLRIIWQFMVFMETDLYYVIATALYCPDLHRMSRDYLRTRIRRALGRPPRPTEEHSWSERDRRIVRRYAPIVLVGSVLSVSGMLVGTVPIIGGLLTRIVGAIGTGDVLTVRFWDGAIAGVGTVAELALVLAMMVRKRLRDGRERQAAARAGAAEPIGEA
jgi:hypothetical protein